MKAVDHDQLLPREKVNLDIFWLTEESLEESANVPAPHIAARLITDDLKTALQQFATIAEDSR